MEVALEEVAAFRMKGFRWVNVEEGSWVMFPADLTSSRPMQLMYLMYEFRFKRNKSTIMVRSGYDGSHTM